MSFKPMPGVAAPGISVQLLDEKGTRWSLNDARAENFALVIFYRGNHCPICKKQLQRFDQLSEKFDESGAELIAISADDAETAETSRMDWGLDRLRIGYGLMVEQMKDWGLYASEGIKSGEPEIFCEPGLFIVTTDGLKLHYVSITSMPFGRPDPEDILNGVRFIVDETYPTRGAKELESATSLPSG